MEVAVPRGRPSGTTRINGDTGLASLGQMVRRLLELHGLDADAIARAAGVELNRIPEPTERVEIDRGDAIFRRAAELIANPAFGLNAARCWHPANLGVLGHAWLSSSTLRTGLHRLARYWRIVGERATTRIEETRQGLKVAYRRKPGDPVVTAVVTDIAMSIMLDMCRMNAGAALRPVAVSLRRREPPQSDAYRSFYGCPVRFAAEEDAFVLAAQDADRPLPSSNKQLATMFDRLLAGELARLDKGDVLARCRASVLEHLPSGEMTEAEMAKGLHMSRRTLQRKLAEAETTYLELVDDTRRDLALRYLEDPHRTITDITFTLGYSQQSAFTRAFKRWTGVAPSAFRAKSAAAPS
jgi:AraC-like DNA-binding protein